MDLLRVNLHRKLTRGDMDRLSNNARHCPRLESILSADDNIDVLSEALKARGFTRATEELGKRHDRFREHRSTDRDCRLISEYSNSSLRCFQLTDGVTSAFLEILEGENIARIASYRGDPIVVAQILLAVMGDLSVGWPELAG